MAQIEGMLAEQRQPQQISVVSLVISVFGLVVLGRLWRQALRRQAQDPAAPPVSQAVPSALN